MNSLDKIRREVEDKDLGLEEEEIEIHVRSFAWGMLFGFGAWTVLYIGGQAMREWWK